MGVIIERVTDSQQLVAIKQGWVDLPFIQVPVVELPVSSKLAHLGLAAREPIGFRSDASQRFRNARITDITLR